MTYFVDESSIKYDTMREHTKEVYQSQIDYITGIIEDESGYISNISDNEEEIAIYKQSLNDCIAYLEQKKSEAPSEEELYNKAVSYDGYGYEGKKDGVKFYFEFYNDEERNRSAFLVTRNLYDEEGNYIFPKDKIELNEENIEASAVKICEDLGLSGMEVYGIRSEASVDSDLGEQTYYTVKLGRRINDVPVDISTYCYESNEIGNTDDFRVRIYDKSYSREEVVMVFEDKAYAGEYIVFTDTTLVVNAMDGSIIDLDEAGAGSQYKMSNRCEDYE